jgi:hypothetical protein
MRLAVVPSPAFSERLEIDVQADSLPQLLEAVSGALSAEVDHLLIKDSLEDWIVLEAFGDLLNIISATGGAEVQVGVGNGQGDAAAFASANPISVGHANGSEEPTSAQSFWVPSSGALGARFIQDPEHAEESQICIGSVDPDGAAAAAGIVQGMVVRRHTQLCLLLCPSQVVHGDVMRSCLASPVSPLTV